jgi:hypothetical protein
MIGANMSLTAVAIALWSLQSANVRGPAANRDELRYQYVENTNDVVEVARGNALSIGKLDAKGNFIPDKRWLNLTGPFSGPPVERFLNASSKRVTKRWVDGNLVVDTKIIPVYEFRSRRLIKGIIDDDHNFIPEVGAKVIDFEDYKYGAAAPKIYNLPGKFVRVHK